MELVLGGVSAIPAAFVTNPLEVVKIRMQLQGELQSKGHYKVHYRNVFHAGYVIAKNEGILALQKGLPSSLLYQFVMNGTRLGLYDICDKNNLTRNKDGRIAPLKSLACASLSGAISGMVGSPIYLAKTMLQAQSNSESIAVGVQHKHGNMWAALKYVYSKYGVFGLWRGMTSNVYRVLVGSAVQLSTFEKSLELARRAYPTSNRWSTAFLASLISGLAVSVAMSPLDLVSTRVYNQAVDKNGKGVSYSSVLDCGMKIAKQEGLRGFYKGWTASYFRLGPHTLLHLMIWDEMKHYHKTYIVKQKKQ